MLKYTLNCPMVNWVYFCVCVVCMPLSNKMAATIDEAEKIAKWTQLISDSLAHVTTN